MKFYKYLILSLALVVASCKPAEYAELEDGIYANMKTNKGDILLKLEFEKTPVTVANFVSLAEGTNEQVVDSLKGKPYYDGIVFHRVIADFMIQGGDPTATGSGSPGYKFIDEFPKNEEGELILKHDKPGILSMANSGPTTNGSQFFITHKDTPWLDGLHTVFGNVIKGQSVVDSIAQMDTIQSVEIIKLGKDAKKFKADEKFTTYFEKQAEELKKKEEALKIVHEEALKKFEENRAKAIELPSGLKYVITETKDGVKPNSGASVKVHYAAYGTDGKLFMSSYKDVSERYQVYNEARDKQGGYEPFTTVYGPEARLIPGFREGLQQMKVGDKAMFFIPSHLGYGPQGARGMIPPNTDLVFELEITELVTSKQE